MFKEQSPSYPWMREGIALAAAEAFTQKPFPGEKQHHQVTVKGRGHGHTLKHRGHPVQHSQVSQHLHLQWWWSRGSCLPKGGLAEHWYISGAESAQLFPWQLLLKSQHCISPGAEATLQLLGASPRPTSQQQGWPACVVSALTQATGHWVQRGAVFLKAPREQQKEDPEELGSISSCLAFAPQQGNGPLRPASCANPLASSWLPRLAVSCWQGTGSSFCSHCLHPHVHFPKGDWLEGGEWAERHTAWHRETYSKQAVKKRNTNSSGGVQRIFQEHHQM